MKLLSSKYSDTSFSLGILLLRLFAGSAMAFSHGYKKLTGFNEILAKGFPDPFHVGTKISLGLTVFAEFFCAILIIIGLLSRLATIPLIIAMSVALFIAHKGQFFGEGEMAGLFLVIFITLLLTGPGKYSADKLIGK